MAPADRQDEAPRRALWLRLLPLGLIVAGIAAAFASGLDRYLSYEALVENRDWLQAEVAAAPVVAALAFGLAYAVVVALSLPGGAIMTLLGGFLFGTWVGGSLVVLSATVGAAAVFLAARTAFGDALRRRAGGAVERMRAGFRRNAFSYLLFLRLVPVFPFFLVNLVPAFLDVPLATYVAATALGIVPGTFVFASVGNGLGAVLDAGARPDLSIATRPEVFGPLLALGLLSLVPVLIRRRRGGTEDGG